MNASANAAPGRSRPILFLRSLANGVRSFIRFRLLQRWVTVEGMTRIGRHVHLNSPHKRIIFGNRVQWGRTAMSPRYTLWKQRVVRRRVSFTEEGTIL